MAFRDCQVTPLSVASVLRATSLSMTLQVMPADSPILTGGCCFFSYCKPLLTIHTHLPSSHLRTPQRALETCNNTKKQLDIICLHIWDGDLHSHCNYPHTQPCATAHTPRTSSVQELLISFAAARFSIGTSQSQLFHLKVSGSLLVKLNTS